MANQIGEYSGRVDGRFSNVYDGSIRVNDSELSDENRRLLQSFNNRDYGITELRDYDLDSISKIVEEEMKMHPTGSVGDLTVDYYQPYITKILNDITSQRNRIVNSVYQKNDEINVLSSLDKLAKSANFLANCQRQYLGKNIVNEAVKTQAANLSEIIKGDIQKLPQYNQERIETMTRYQSLKDEYEKKSRFGRFIARLTGKTGELDAARAQAHSYNNVYPENNSPVVINNGSTQYQFADVENPNNYSTESQTFGGVRPRR